MEDKYLVKAKRTDNREWVVGGLVRYGFTGKEKYYIVPDIVLNNSCNIPIGKWEPMICDWKTTDFKEYRKAVDYEVIGNIFDNPELNKREKTYCKDGNDYER